MVRLLNKALIVDDDSLMLRVLEALLKAGGYEVYTANNGRDALALVEKHQPSYLITDWEMPGMDGLELCRRVRQLELPGYLYIVFVTVRSAQNDLMDAMAAGADDFLTKPVHKHELMARLTAGARVLHLESRLSQMATHDALTDLCTRRAFGEFFTKEWERARRYRLPCSVVMFDIDFFKQVNDTYGHPIGDEVIRHVGNTLRHYSRKSDVVCRWGGEEFCVMLPETDENAARLWAERVRQRLTSEGLQLESNVIQTTVSAGVAGMLAEMEVKEDLLALVDQCLLAAKEQGRNRVVAFREMMVSGDHNRFTAMDDSPIFHGVAAREAMIPLVHCVGPAWTVAEAAAYLLQYRVSSVPVTDETGNLIGIISDKDVLNVTHAPQAAGMRVEEIMRSNVIAYADDAPLERIVNFLTRAPMRSVIVSANGKPCGMISRASVVRWFLEHRWKTQPELKGESSPPVHGSETGMFELSSRLVQTAQRLQDGLLADPERTDPAPIIGGASQLQQLIEDLLAGTQLGGGLPF